MFPVLLAVLAYIVGTRFVITANPPRVGKVKTGREIERAAFGFGLNFAAVTYFVATIWLMQIGPVPNVGQAVTVLDVYHNLDGVRMGRIGWTDRGRPYERSLALDQELSGGPYTIGPRFAVGDQLVRTEDGNYSILKRDGLAEAVKR